MSPNPPDLHGLLRHSVDEIEPSADWDDVLDRSRRAQHAVRVRMGIAAVIALVALGAVSVPFLVRDDGRSVDVVTTPTPSTTPSTTSPSTSAPAGTVPASGTAAVGVWPFATAEAADAWPADRGGRDFSDPVDTAEGFLVDFLDAGSLQLGPFMAGDARSGEIEATEPVTGMVTTVLLRQVGSSDAWTVIGATSTRLEIHSPEAGATVASPVEVRGAVSAFEGNVVVQLRDSSGAMFGQDFGIGGSGPELGPFVVDVEVEPGAPTGPASVVAMTYSARDGSLEQVAAVPVELQHGDLQAAWPAGAALEGHEAVAVVRTGTSEGADIQDVAVIDTRDGSVVRTLAPGFTTHEGGVLDLALTPDRRTVLVSYSTSACGAAVEARATDGSGSPVSVSRTAERVALSAAGRLALASDEDCDGVSSIVVQTDDGWRTYGETGGESASGLSEGSSLGYPIHVTDLAWADDGTLTYLVQYEDGTDMHWLRPDRDESGLMVVDETSDLEWSSLSFRSNGVVVASGTCCLGGDEKSSAVILDVDRGGQVIESLDLAGATPIRVVTSPGPDRLLWIDDDGTLWSEGSADPIRGEVVLISS